ncbi:hypothetical protein [Rhodoferax sp. GW822-FHT02A01]|uniref:hypothetical protein n=1 Tax=Rhodoferax sp. GW822-FHT02A01 TaxID=3141537 RepID=UPI00315D5555
MRKHVPPVHQIELRIDKLSELFNSMDPTPFHHCDLDRDAQEYLESWAMEFPSDSHFRIIVHMEQMPDQDPTPLVAEAIHNFFDYKTTITKRQLGLLLREGRVSLLIGLAFLLLCLLGADLLSGNVGNTFLRVLRESLIIGGWVAMWRPLQIFLYEWWPSVRHGRIYRNLAKALVHVTPATPK